MVILTAEPGSGYQFASWLGDVDTIADVSAAITTITMDSSYSISADFQATSSPCCTATAAYGTPMAEEIGILRQFRDEYLLTDPLGKTVSDFYYSVSPPIAGFITEHPGLKSIVRAGLVPAIAMSTVAVNTSPAEKVAIVGLLLVVLVVLAVWLIKRRHRNLQRA
jgi:cobalamin biosynthesis Mg chelatase CobN